MTRVPELRAGPLRLVPFGPRHLSEKYVSWLNDPAVVRFSEQRHHHHSLESCAAYIATFERGPNMLWAIEIAHAATHIGNISASFDMNNRLADIGILIGNRTMQGKGNGRHAWGAVLEHLTARADIRKVTGGCLEANAAMVRVMRDCGMVEDGYRRDHYLVEGKPTSLLYFSKPGKWTPLGL